MELKIDFWDLLTLTFVVLKLVGIIEWRWIFVLCPYWINIFLTILVFLIF